MRSRDIFQMKVLEELKSALEVELSLECSELVHTGKESSPKLRSIRYRLLAVERKLNAYVEKSTRGELRVDKYSDELKRREQNVKLCLSDIEELKEKMALSKDALGMPDFVKIREYNDLITNARKRLGALEYSLRYWESRKEGQLRFAEKPEKVVIVKEIESKKKKDVKEMPEALRRFMTPTMIEHEQADPNDFFGASKRYTSTPMDLSMLLQPSECSGKAELELELEPELAAQSQKQEDSSNGI